MTPQEKEATSSTRGPGKALFDFRLDVLLAEFKALQDNIRHHDTILYQIKGWSITVIGAVVVFAIQQAKPRIALLAGTLVVMFWLVETLAKVVQRTFIARYNRVEHFLRNKAELEKAWSSGTFPDINFPDITARYSVRDIEFKIGFFRAAITRYTCSLYILQLLVVSGVYCLLAYRLL